MHHQPGPSPPAQPPSSSVPPRTSCPVACPPHQPSVGHVPSRVTGQRVPPACPRRCDRVSLRNWTCVSGCPHWRSEAPPLPRVSVSVCVSVSAQTAVFGSSGKSAPRRPPSHVQHVHLEGTKPSRVRKENAPPRAARERLGTRGGEAVGVRVRACARVCVCVCPSRGEHLPYRRQREDLAPLFGPRSEGTGGDDAWLGGCDRAQRGAGPGPGAGSM